MPEVWQYMESSISVKEKDYSLHVNDTSDGEVNANSRTATITNNGEY